MKRLDKTILMMAAAGFLTLGAFSCRTPGECCGECGDMENPAAEHPDGDHPTEHPSDHPEHPEG